MNLKIEATFLGTGTSTGIPMLACECVVCKSLALKDKRTRTSIFLKVNEYKFLIDTGPDLRTQLLRENINDIDAIFLTHYHKDHIAGLEDIRGISVLRKKKIPVYTNFETIKTIKREFYYVFEKNKPPGLMDLELFDINKQNFYFKEILITPINVLHDKLEVLGFRIGNLTYITDVSFIAREELKKIVGSKILIISALQKEKHIAHFSLQDILKIIKDLKIPQAYLTHINHRMGLHDKVTQELPKNIYLAHDGLKIIL